MKRPLLYRPVTNQAVSNLVEVHALQDFVGGLGLDSPNKIGLRSREGNMSEYVSEDGIKNLRGTWLDVRRFSRNDSNNAGSCEHPIIPALQRRFNLTPIEAIAVIREARLTQTAAPVDEAGSGGGNAETVCGGSGYSNTTYAPQRKPSSAHLTMNQSRILRSTRVCSEVPGGEGDVMCSIGGFLTIFSLPIAIHGADEDLQARRGRCKNAEPEKIAGTAAPIAPRSLETGQPPERLKATPCCHRDDDLTSKRRGSAEKSYRRRA